jgi:hypothetical protein
MGLNAETMRAFQNSQRAYIDGAVVEGYPYGKKLWIPAHELVVLMSMRDEALAIRKDQSPNRFWMHQNLLTDEHPHHLKQRGLMRQRVERLQIEDLLVDALERGVGIAAGCFDIGHALPRVVIG